MDGPDGIRLDAAIGSTDRGWLWRATRQRQHDRIVRIVDPRFCDGRFRTALTNLRQRQHPRMVEITGEGWSGAHFYIEYAVTSPWQTLTERLAELSSWRDRLLVLKRVCEVLPLWRNSPVHPLGLNLRSIVMMRDAGRWYPWLLPCPAISVPSPCDLFGVDPPVVAALAPEVIRGVQMDQRAQDSYALGTLAAQIVGCRESRLATDGESLVEAQARGALLRSWATRSTLPEGLHTAPQVQRLFQTIAHYRHTTPHARPAYPDELKSALEKMTDSVKLAGVFRTSDPALALDVLSSVSKHDGIAYAQSAELAAKICAETGDLRAAVRHLDDAVSVLPEQLDLRLRRSDLRWTLFESAVESTRQAGAAGRDDGWTARDEDLLLEDLTVRKHLGQRGDTLPYLRAAEVYRRRGDLTDAANELFDATKLDPSDMAALFGYARCWVELGEPTKAAGVANTAIHRIDRLEKLNLIPPTEAHRWRVAFDIFLR